MKKLFVGVVLVLLMSSPVFAQNSFKANLTKSLEFGFMSGLKADYNFTPSLSMGGQLGMYNELAYTAPYGAFVLSTWTPAVSFYGSWYFFRPKKKDNKGFYLSLGLMGDGGYFSSYRDYSKSTSWSVFAFLKLGVEYPIYKNLNFKASVLINEGGGASIDYISRKPASSYNEPDFTLRNELLFDLGFVCHF